MSARLDGLELILTLETGERYRLNAEQVRIWRDTFAGFLAEMEEGE